MTGVIKITTTGAFGKVELDGYDVSSYCTGYTVEHRTGAVPIVTLTLLPGDLIVDNSAAEVIARHVVLEREPRDVTAVSDRTKRYAVADRAGA